MAAGDLAPLLAPAHLGQVRTNEFLVGAASPDPTQATPWELREWHLGEDGQLHLARSQAGGRSAARPDRRVRHLGDAERERDAERRQRPCRTSFLAVTSSENGSRIHARRRSRPDQLSTALNQLALRGLPHHRDQHRVRARRRAVRRHRPRRRSPSSCATSCRAARTTSWWSPPAASSRRPLTRPSRSISLSPSVIRLRPCSRCTARSSSPSRSARDPSSR